MESIELTQNRPHTAPSVGSITKKIVTINPELSAHDVIALIKHSILKLAPTEVPGDFVNMEVIDEAKALRLAHESVTRS